MIDTHTHIADTRFDLDRREVIARARMAGVTVMIHPSVDLKDLQKALQLSQSYEELYILAGLYPGEAQKNLKWREDLRKIEELCKSEERIVGIGEIGLDEYWIQRDKKTEIELFDTQLELALKLSLPVAIHSRGTEATIWEIFKRYQTLPRGVMHCFSGSVEWLEYTLSRGFYIGFDGNVTYKNAEQLHALARRVPLERLVLETDAPYLPPEGKRGQRNESANVRITTEYLAKLRSEDLGELISKTTQNARELFGL